MLIFAAGEVKGRTASGPGLSCRERSRLKDLLPISIQRHLAKDHAAYCSNLGYFSAKLLLDGGCGFGCSLSDEGSVLTKNAVTAGYDLGTTLYFSSPQKRQCMPKDWNEASRCHTLLDGWQKRLHRDRSVILMELRMSN